MKTCARCGRLCTLSPCCVCRQSASVRSVYYHRAARRRVVPDYEETVPEPRTIMERPFPEGVSIATALRRELDARCQAGSTMALLVRSKLEGGA